MDKIYKSLSHIHWTDDSVTWPRTDDFGYLPILKGCETPRNVIYYFSEDIIEGDADLYKKLHPTDKAGLIVHEVVYALARKISKVKTSLIARRITALLFSDLKSDYILKNFVLNYLVLDIDTKESINIKSRSEVSKRSKLRFKIKTKGVWIRLNDQGLQKGELTLNYPFLLTHAFGFNGPKYGRFGQLEASWEMNDSVASYHKKYTKNGDYQYSRDGVFFEENLFPTIFIDKKLILNITYGRR